MQFFQRLEKAVHICLDLCEKCILTCYATFIVNKCNLAFTITINGGHATAINQMSQL